MLFPSFVSAQSAYFPKFPENNHLKAILETSLREFATPVMLSAGLNTVPVARHSVDNDKAAVSARISRLPTRYHVEIGWVSSMKDRDSLISSSNYEGLKERPMSARNLAKEQLKA